METINAVNFEDLFDFSPESVDRLSHDERDFQPSPLTIPPIQAPPNSYSSSSSGNFVILQIFIRTLDKYNTYSDITANYIAVIYFISITIMIVNIQASINTTTERSTSDVFADFDAITHGLLGDSALKGQSATATTTADSQKQHLQTQIFHQSQHPNKQR